MRLRYDEPSQALPDIQAAGHHARRESAGAEGAPAAANGLTGKFREQPVLNTTLVALAVAAIVLAYTAIGPSSRSSGQSTRTTTVKRGVVQSTVSGSGNVQSADELNLGFKTSGTVTHIYIKKGQHVTQGQLLATLNPKSAEVTLLQARATLKSAEATLAQEEENEGETSSGQGSTSTTPATAAIATTSTVAYTTNVVAKAASEATPTSAATPTTSTGSPSTATETSTTPTATTTASTKTPTPSATTTTPSSPSSTSKSGGSSQSTKTTESTATSPTNGSSQGTSSSSTKQSAATREANLASARAAVKSDKLTVESDEQAVQNARMYAPENGTIVSVSGEIGETVSGTGTTKATSTSSSSSSSSSSAGTGGKSSSAAGVSTAGTASSASQGSSSSSSSFAVLGNLESLQLVVALSESEIGNVKVGQIATVTIEALNGRKLAAHVVSVSQVPTSTTGAVSYDVTFRLDQGASGLKVGMSATAEVVVKQAEGLNVPTSAIKAGSITVIRNGRQTSQAVTTGLAGNSATIVLSGLEIGEQVVLPTTTTSASGSTVGSRGGIGGGGLGGGGFPGGGFPGGGPPGG